MESQVKITGDGSSTLYIPGLNEHYHSVNGAVQESEHIFIGMGLKTLQKSVIRLFELGFGTGLNALLTLMHGKDSVIQYHTIELHPLELSLITSLRYAEFLCLPEETRDSFTKIHQAPWGMETAINEKYSIRKIKASILDYPLENNYDLIYFDAFAPAVQPELWEEPLFVKLYESLNHGGILVTYCAKGEVRRRMQHAGFTVERLPGPPGKREILRAIRMGT
jgi:tRNA U34 5-methylaminomethyl-2-thiouridine-forming methyltransferase MnmC